MIEALDFASARLAHLEEIQISIMSLAMSWWLTEVLIVAGALAALVANPEKMSGLFSHVEGYVRWIVAIFVVFHLVFSGVLSRAAYRVQAEHEATLQRLREAMPEAAIVAPATDFIPLWFSMALLCGVMPIFLAAVVFFLIQRFLMTQSAREARDESTPSTLRTASNSNTEGHG